MSNLFSRWLLAMRAGLRFGGKRDLYQVFGYEKTLTFDHYLFKYTRQNIAKRIVDAPPAATWRREPVISGGTKGFDEAWKNFARDNSVYQVLDHVDRIAGIGRYGILLIGVDDGLKLEYPVKKGKREILYMQPYTEGSAKILELDGDSSSPRFGLPTYYELQQFDPKQVPSIQKVAKTQPVKVHWSRVIHVAENTLEDRIFGTPRLEAVFNDLDDLLKVVGGASECYWLVGNRGLHVDVDKEMELGPDDEKALSDEIEEYQHELRRAIRTRGVKVTPLAGTPPDPRGAFAATIALISGTTKIPQRVLLGSEAGHLASDQDRTNWADSIAERQTDHAEPHLLRPFIDWCVEHQIIPKYKQLEVEWPRSIMLTPLEEAQMMAQKARAIVNVSKHYDSEPLITISEAREMLLLPAEPSEPLPERREPEPKVPPGGDGSEDDGNSDEGKEATPPESQPPQKEPEANSGGLFRLESVQPE
jgi:hypothetical protein